MTVICINCTVPPLLSFLGTVGIFASAFRFFCSGFSLPSSPHPACPLARRIYFHATLAHCHRKCHTHTQIHTETQPHSSAVSQRLGKQATWLHWLLALSSCCRFLLHWLLLPPHSPLPLSLSICIYMYVYIVCLYHIHNIHIFIAYLLWLLFFFFCFLLPLVRVACATDKSSNCDQPHVFSLVVSLCSNHLQICICMLRLPLMRWQQMSEVAVSCNHQLQLLPVL